MNISFTFSKKSARRGGPRWIFILMSTLGPKIKLVGPTRWAYKNYPSPVEMRGGLGQACGLRSPCPYLVDMPPLMA